MKSIPLITFILTCCLNVSAQPGKLFDIEQTVISNRDYRKARKEIKRHSPHFFEDEHYLVRKTCMGEFGGTVFFKNKNTGIEHACGATCPVVVNKINGKYIVSNTLLHYSGFSEVILIDHPDSMPAIKPELINGKRNLIVREPGNVKERTSAGIKQLAYTFNCILLASFPFEGQLYHITSDFEKAYVSKIENMRFVNIDTVCNESIRPWEPEVIQTADDHAVIFFKKGKSKGYLDIAGNKIRLMKCK